MKLIQISILGLLAAGIVGCGGGSDSASKARGRLPVTVTWPVPSRLIPQASNSIVVSLVRADSTSIAQTLTIVRPTTTAFFDGVPVGSYTVRADAKPLADGTGTTQATGATAPLSVVSGDNPPFAITMDSTVTQVRLGIGGGSFLFKDSGGPNATLVSSTGASSGSLTALPVMAGDSPITLEARSATDALVLVNTASVLLTASGDANFDVHNATAGSASGYDLTRNSNGLSTLTATYTDPSPDFVLRLPIYVLRSFATVSLPAGSAVDASQTGVAVNGATPGFVPIDGTATPAVQSSAVAYAAGFATTDEIRAGATLGESVASKVASATVTYRKTTGAADANDGVKTVTGVTAIYDVAAANGRILLLADVAAGRRIVEIPVTPPAGGRAVGTVIAGDMSGATDLAASATDVVGTTILSVQRSGHIERYGLTTVVLTANAPFNALNIPSGRDVAVTQEFSFVLDNQGRIHTYDLNGAEYALSLPLPNGLAKRIAAAKNGSRTYLVATSTGLTGSEVSVFQEAP